jgi:hypothetical protein
MANPPPVIVHWKQVEFRHAEALPYQRQVAYFAAWFGLLDVLWCRGF